jgi:hypothetical protein
MNYFPSGGGAHQPLPDEPNTMRSMVTLMHAAGVRHVRWWWQSPSGAEMFAAAGMSLLPNILTYDATYATSAYYDQLTQRTGSWLVGEHNEPDLGPTSAEAFTKSRIPACKASRQYAASMQLCGPALGGELLGPGGDYLEQCYNAGLKDALDAVDIHLYGFNGTAPVPGAGNSEGPENLLTELAHCREIMAKHGDANRPIIATETGCSTCGPRITADVQAQWIVRTHLLLAAAGVRRIYWYAFQDEGTNPTNGEHHFGIVDWYGHPKPAYATYRVMT